MKSYVHRGDSPNIKEKGKHWLNKTVSPLYPNSERRRASGDHYFILYLRSVQEAWGPVCMTESQCQMHMGVGREGCGGKRAAT
eukprot:722654-Pelagomonas_calceolata.AAC.2